MSCQRLRLPRRWQLLLLTGRDANQHLVGIWWWSSVKSHVEFDYHYGVDLSIGVFTVRLTRVHVKGF